MVINQDLNNRCHQLKRRSSQIFEVAQAGYGKTTKQVRNISGRLVIDKKRKKIPSVSHGWFQRFMQRKPCLSHPKGDPTANVRIN